MRRRGGIPGGVILAVAGLYAGTVCATSLKFEIILDAGEIQRKNAPVTVQLAADAETPQLVFARLGASPGVILKAAGERKEIPAQAEFLRLADGRPAGAMVRFVEGDLASGASKKYELILTDKAGWTGPGFRLESGEGFNDLLFGSLPVWRHMIAYDPARHEETYKPYIHIFDAPGKEFITKGPGGLYTHHRGLFLGWNQTRAGDRVMDFWHCPDVAQRHVRYLAEREHLGAVMGRIASRSEWLDPDGKPVVRDVREVSTWRLGESDWLLDCTIRIESAKGVVELGGDAQHAGFQFRAAQEVAERKAETAYVRPGAAAGGANDVWENCPWAACLFKIGKRPYAVMHMNYPENPAPTVYSTRDYGRFGAFFSSRLGPTAPLDLKYRILVQGPQSKREWEPAFFADRYQDYVQPVTIRGRRLPMDSDAVNCGAILPAKAPKGAVILFDGRDLGAWTHRDGSPGRWPVKQGSMETSGGDLVTKRVFKDFILHVEFLCPKMPLYVTGQKRSNSGVYIQRRYEIQILDSFGLEAGKGDCAAIYNIKAPDSNACRAPDSWQAYDIAFRSSRWDREGRKVENARVTVFHNGLLVHDDVQIPAKTGAGEPEGPEAGPILLQDHGDDVLFRNVWIVPRGNAGAAD